MLAGHQTARAALVGRFPHAKSLLLSADGRVAFATDTYSDMAGKTRVWQVLQKQEIAALPTEAGIAIAVSRDGKRVLCRRKFDEVESSFALWWRPHGRWEKGTIVRNRGKHRLLDAQFVGADVALLWPGGIEGRDANGCWRQMIRWRSASEIVEQKVEAGALSRRGSRAALFLNDDGVRNYRAFVLEARSGQQLSRLELAQNPEQFGWNVEWKFSPDASIIGWSFGWLQDLAPTEGTNTTQTLWDARTGRKLSESSNPLLAFWPGNRPSVVHQLASGSTHKIERLDARTQQALSVRPTRIGEGVWISELRFAGDGERLVALDENGAIWEQQIR